MTGPHAPSPRLISARAGLAGAILAGAFVLASVAIVAFLATRAAPLPLRSTIGPASWIPTPQHGERGFAKLEQGDERP